MAKQETFTFTLILSGVSGLTEEVADALFEAGCDDALLGIRDGVVFLDFDREAPSLREAALSAIADVEGAGVGAAVTRVEPDELVTMAEIARRLGRSRESVRQLVTGERGPGHFPPPVANLTQKSPIWRWADVEPWFRENVGSGAKSKPTLKQASAELPTVASLGTVAAINAALELRRHVKDVNEATRLCRVLLTPRKSHRRDRQRPGRGTNGDDR
jgi:hypothetical protein